MGFGDRCSFPLHPPSPNHVTYVVEKTTRWYFWPCHFCLLVSCIKRLYRVFLLVKRPLDKEGLVINYWTWSQGDSPQNCHMAFGCPTYPSALIRWDSITPFSWSFSLNHLDREIFLSMPHLSAKTYMSGTVGDPAP